MCNQGKPFAAIAVASLREYKARNSSQLLPDAIKGSHLLPEVATFQVAHPFLKAQLAYKSAGEAGVDATIGLE